MISQSEVMLGKEYLDDKVLRQWFKSVMAVALTPPEKVETAWLSLLDKSNESDESDKSLLEKYPTLDKFNNYFTSNWIESSTWTIGMWNQYDNTLRTNNHVEGYNLRINKILVTPHPNIWKLIEFLQRENTTMTMTFERLEKNLLRTSSRNKMDIQFDLDIERLKNKYIVKSITLEEYVASLSSKMTEYSAELMKKKNLNNLCFFLATF